MTDAALYLAVWCAWAALHSLTMSPWAKALAARRLGPRFAFYRLGFTALSLATFGLAALLAPRLAPGLMSASAEPLYHAPGWAAGLLWAVRLAGLAFFAWTCRFVDLREFIGLRQARDYPTGRVDRDGEAAGPRVLVRVGPHALVRHPMYLAGTAILFADPAMTLEKLLFAGFALAYFLVGSRFEEARLIATFGDEYRDYQRAVPRIWPRIWPQKPN